MTRRDFELIARVLRENRKGADAGELRRCEDIARDFAAELCTTNARFDRMRFLRACGVEG